MNFPAIITEKKLGHPLSDEAIAAFVRGAADGSVPDYQLSALLMAIRLNGMDARETTTLTMEMARSGDMLHPDLGGTVVDKHSTGGVGDTTTLVLVPLCAACGAKIAAGAKFCPECGAKQNAGSFCTSCGKEIPAGTKFCPECGAKQ